MSNLPRLIRVIPVLLARSTGFNEGRNRQKVMPLLAVKEKVSD